VPFQAGTLARSKAGCGVKASIYRFADFQIAATALEDGAELLTFNVEHFPECQG